MCALLPRSRVASSTWPALTELFLHWIRQEPHQVRGRVGSPPALLVLRRSRVGRDGSLVAAAAGGGGPARAQRLRAAPRPAGLVLAPGRGPLPVALPVQAQRLPAPRGGGGGGAGIGTAWPVAHGRARPLAGRLGDRRARVPGRGTARRGLRPGSGRAQEGAGAGGGGPSRRRTAPGGRRHPARCAGAPPPAGRSARRLGIGGRLLPGGGRLPPAHGRRLQVGAAVLPRAVGAGPRLPADRELSLLAVARGLRLLHGPHVR